MGWRNFQYECLSKRPVLDENCVDFVLLNVRLDKKRILPCCTYLEGEFGINGLCVGVPVKLGAGGMEQIMEIKLTSEEQAALRSSADSVQELVDVMNKAKAESSS